MLVTRWAYGSKVGIDATRKWAEEGFEREWPEEINMDELTKTLVDQKWQDYFAKTPILTKTPVSV